MPQIFIGRFRPSRTGHHIYFSLFGVFLPPSVTDMFFIGGSRLLRNIDLLVVFVIYWRLLVAKKCLLSCSGEKFFIDTSLSLKTSRR
jgi:hypothetical protein